MGGYCPIYWESDRTKDGGKASFLCLFLNWNIHLFPAFGHQSSWSLDLRILGLPRCSPSPAHSPSQAFGLIRNGTTKLSWFSSLQRTNYGISQLLHLTCVRVCVYVCVCVCTHVLSCVWLCMTLWTALCPWNFQGKNTRVGCCFLLQEIFLIQGLNSRLLCLLHWHVILYHCTTWEAHHYMSQGNSCNKSPHIFI